MKATSAKYHFEVLDGLRGTVALLVVLYHLTETIFPEIADKPLYHAYLGVDFFFLLSGFVVGYAYDKRWPKMTVAGFMRIRLIRLHPLVVLSVVIGVLCYVLDPFAGSSQQVDAKRIIVRLLPALLVLPAPALPNRWDTTHSLNGPCWSLFQEYIVNIVYALIGPKLSRRGLNILVAASGVVLVATSLYVGDLQGGWAWHNFWIGFVRVAFPFFAGLLLFRLNIRLRVRWAFPLLSFVLLLLFVVPSFSLNSVFEIFCIICIFPVIVAAGAGGHVSGRLRTVCLFFGRIFYPIYILHYPFISIYANWIKQQQPAVETAIGVAAGLLVFFVGLAYAALKLYDEPFRAWLQSYFSGAKKRPAAPATAKPAMQEA